MEKQDNQPHNQWTKINDSFTNCGVDVKGEYVRTSKLGHHFIGFTSNNGDWGPNKYDMPISKQQFEAYNAGKMNLHSLIVANGKMDVMLPQFKMDKINGKTVCVDKFGPYTDSNPESPNYGKTMLFVRAFHGSDKLSVPADPNDFNKMNKQDLFVKYFGENFGLTQKNDQKQSIGQKSSFSR